jgi:hypothetical protein
MTNAILGFGSQPAGISAGGLGTPLGLPSPGTSYESVADLVAARAIDLATRDYVVDDTGAFHGSWDPLLQRVVLALTTRRGRLPFEQTLGNDFLNLQKAPADLQASAKNSAALALKDLTDAGLVAIDAVEVLQVGGAAVEAVTWTDLAKRQQRTTATRLHGHDHQRLSDDG